MELDEALEKERVARRAAASATAAAERRREAEAAWFSRRPWASPADDQVQSAEGEMAQLLRDAVHRLPARRWRDGLLYRDMDGNRRLARSRTGAWRARAFEAKVRYVYVDAGDGKLGNSYESGRPPSWSFALLDSGDHVGEVGPLGRVRDRLVKVILD